MINDTIKCPRNEMDDFCNMLITTSNDMSKEIGISYGEFWVYIMSFVIFLIAFYIVLTGSALYIKNKLFIKVIYWISIALLIVIFIHIIMFISVL